MALADTLDGFRFRDTVPANLDLTRFKQLRERLERKAEGMDTASELEPAHIEGSILNIEKGSARRRDYKIVASAGLERLQNHPQATSLVPSFLNHILAKGGTLLNALLSGYLIAPSHEGWIWKKVHQILVDHQDQLPARKRNALQRFRLLEPDAGKQFVDLASKIPLEHIHRLFDDAGLRGLKANGAVAKQIFRSCCQAISKNHSGDNLERFFELIKDNDGIRFERDTVGYATALLTPYLSTKPIFEVERTIRNFCVEHLSDPRLNPAPWADVDQDLSNVLKRWLAADSIGMLLKIVAKSNETKHWEERRPFWQQYFDKGYVTDAWVALGKNAAIEARALKRSGELESSTTYGVISAGEVQANHSVLILRIDDLIITEWTHDGKVRFFNARNEKRPEFYKRSYSAYKVRDDFGADEFFSHYRGWQDKVKRYIARHTGAKV